MHGCRSQRSCYSRQICWAGRWTHWGSFSSASEEGAWRDKNGAGCKEKGGEAVTSIKKLSWVSREASRMLEIPQQTTSSLAPIMILPVHRKLTNLTDVPSALSVPSEEQYSKCTYPHCFDFSMCPLTQQPFQVFVYNHHYRVLFNLMYPAMVGSFVTQSSCTPDILTHGAH